MDVQADAGDELQRHRSRPGPRRRDRRAAPHLDAPGYVTVYVKVADVEASLQQAVAAGASVLIPTMPIGQGMKIAVFKDPEGHPFGLCDM